MYRVRPPQFVFFDVGLVLLHPDGTRLRSLVEAITGQVRTADELVFAYRLTIRERDTGAAAAPLRFNFWGRWCHHARLKGVYAEEIMAGVTELEGEGLWSVIDEDALRTLEGLQRLGIRAGVISNADGRLAADLKRSGLFDYLAPCIDSVIVGVEKPNPGIFELALQHARVPQRHCWMIGDDYLNDIIPTRQLRFGLSILFEPRPLTPSLPGPIARRLVDILKWAEAG